MSSTIPNSLVHKIKERTARIGVIGLGYVGLPLAVEFSKIGFRTVGIDVSKERVRAINKSRSYIPDVSHEEIRSLVSRGKLKATTKYEALRELDAVMICVPTPLRKTRDPDISYIVATSEALAKYLHRHQIIVLESTTYPGTTDELILPMLEATGLRVGKDFFLGFSPERIDPGNKQYTTSTIPKVISGITPECRRMIQLLYGQVIGRVIPVSSTRVAEMVKLLENTFRSVNIGMVNELALMCRRLGVDVWEVIEAAKSKPFGFMAFYPGPGLGGHCIPIDPLYLSWKAKLHGFESRFIELASQVNGAMPEYVAHRVAEVLNTHRKSLKGSEIFIVGVAYKKDVGDIRESPALEIIRELRLGGAGVRYHDPFVPQFKNESVRLRSTPLTPAAVAHADCVVIVTDHTSMDYRMVVRKARLIVDTRNALRHFRPRPTKVVLL